MLNHPPRRARRRLIAPAILAGGIIMSSAFVSGASAADVEFPDNATEQAEALARDAGYDTPWRSAVNAAINPDDYECSESGLVGQFFDDQLNGVDGASFGVIDNFAVLDWPIIYSIFFDQNASDEYIGVDGDYTRELAKRHRSGQRFWDVDLSDVLLQGLHGSVIADDAKMLPALQWAFGVSEEEAQFAVDLVQETIINDPALDFDHPLFSFNALAFSTEGELVPGIGAVSDKILMGDGLLEYFEAAGFAENGADFVHAHEVAHHVQWEIGAFDSDLDLPEATRRTELMADAFAAYNVGHPRGASFQTKRILDVVAAAFDAGDCGFDFPGHHGTPNQREAAAQWGADLAKPGKKRGHITSASTMFDLFEAELPNLVAPDAN